MPMYVYLYALYAVVQGLVVLHMLSDDPDVKDTPVAFLFFVICAAPLVTFFLMYDIFSYFLKKFVMK